MQARVPGVIAVGIVVVIAVVLFRSRDKDRVRESDSASPGVVDEPVSAAPSASPRSPPLASRATASGQQASASKAEPGIVVAPPAVTVAPPDSHSPKAAKPGAPMTVPPSPVVSTAPSVARNNGPAVSPEEVAIDVDKVTLSLRDYRTILGENPVGTNAEITKALNGGNAKQARLLHEGLTRNRDGELVDRWGTPYFFHQLSKDHMEIRSAGQDRRMWTDDDTVSN
jgi:hypothetical protein